jgi:glutaminyl-tRNA synthetase
VVKDDKTGDIVELRCTYDPETKGGNAPDGRKVKATLHWVSAPNAISATVKLYSHLFTEKMPGATKDGREFTDCLNPDSLEVLSGCRLEPSLANASAGDIFQFERLGYYCVDSKESKPEALVFNRTVTLRDEWAKLRKKKS